MPSSIVVEEGVCRPDSSSELFVFIDTPLFGGLFCHNLTLSTVSEYFLKRHIERHLGQSSCWLKLTLT